MDAEGLDLEPGTFDAAICRLGFMYLPDLPAALEAIRRAPAPLRLATAADCLRLEQKSFGALLLVVAGSA